MDRISRAALLLTLPAIAAGGLGGCAGTSSNYPSLAPRAVEKTGGAPAARPVVAAAPLDAELGARLAAIETDAQAADDRFRAELPQVQRLATAAGAPGGERWSQAQEALSALQTIRSEGNAASGELDERAHAIASSPDPSPAALAAISATQARLGALDAAHAAALEALAKQLTPAS